MKNTISKFLVLLMLLNIFNIPTYSVYAQDTQDTSITATEQSDAPKMADQYTLETTSVIFAEKASGFVTNEEFLPGLVIKKDGVIVDNTDDIVQEIIVGKYSTQDNSKGLRCRREPCTFPIKTTSGTKAYRTYYKVIFKDGSSKHTGTLISGEFNILGSIMDVDNSPGVGVYIYDFTDLQPKKQDFVLKDSQKDLTMSDSAQISQFFENYSSSNFPDGTTFTALSALDTASVGIKTVNVEVALPVLPNSKQPQIKRTYSIEFEVIDRETPKEEVGNLANNTKDTIDTTLDQLTPEQRQKAEQAIDKIKQNTESAINKATTQADIDKLKEEAEKDIQATLRLAKKEDLLNELANASEIRNSLDYTNVDPNANPNLAREYDKVIDELRNLDIDNASDDQINEIKEKIKQAREALDGQERMDEAKKLLEAEIAKEGETKAGLDYTNADQPKKDIYDQKLAEAKTKLADLNANPDKYPTQEKIDEIIKGLQEAEKNLNGKEKMEEAKNNLQAEVDKEQETKESENYKLADPEKIQAYENALTEAKNKLQEAIDKLAESPATTNLQTDETVASALENLENIKNSLNGQQNLNSAKQAITNKENEAKQAINNLVNLTPEEKQAKIREIENKANEARNNIDSATNKAGIDTAKDTGLNELNNLIKQAKKEDLQKEVDKQPTVEGSNDYTNADQTPLQDKYQEELQKAKDILDNPDSTPEQIDEAKNKLREATNNLNGDEKLQTSKEALQAEVYKDKENTPNRITESPKYINADEDKKQAYNTALQNAKNLLDNKATPKEKEEAQKILDNPDSSPEDKAKAQETIAKPTITPEEVAQATTKLQEAENALNGNDKLQEAINNLQAEINKENTTKEDRDYKLADEDKKQAYDTALQEAKDLLDPTKTPNPTRQQLEQALKTLQNKGIGEIADEDNKRDYLNGNENLEQAKQELETLKQQKEQEVNNNPALTNEEKDAIKANLETALTNAKAKLDEANTKSDLSPDNDDASDNKFEEAKKLLDNVSLAPTTKPQAKEANSNLATDIKTQIDNLAHLTPEQKTALKNEVDNKLAEINTNIDAQTTNDDVATKKEEGLKDLQKILNKSKIQNEINRLKEELAINEGTANTNKNPDKITNKNGENGIDSAIANAENILNDFANKTPEELEAEYNSIKEKFVTWDTKLPEANITTPAQTLPTKDNSVNIVFTSEDTPETNNTDKTLNTAPKTGDISYKCAIVENKTDITVITDKKDLENNTTWVDCNSDVFTLDTDNKNLTVNLDNKSEKSYFIAIAPIDTAGNIGTPAIREIIYDKTPPSFSGQVSYSYEINTNDAKNILANVLSGITLEDNLDTELVNNFKANPSNYCKVNPEKIGEANQVGTYTITCNATDHANNVAKTFTRVINIFQRSSGGYSGGSSTPVTTAIPTTPATVTPVVPTENNTTNNPVDNTTAENANNITTLLPSQTTVTPVRSTQSGEQIYSLNSRITDYICPEIVNVYPYTKLVVKDNSIEGTFHDDISALMMFRGLEKDEMNLGQTYEEYKKHGVVLNVEKFEPYRNVTRAEFVKMLVRSLSCRYYYMGTDTNFSDVEQDKWYAEYIKFAVENGWINGYSDGTFRPNNPITRDEAAKILARSIKLTTNNQTTTNFSDIQQNSEFIPYIETLKENGIMKGRNNETFAPKSYIPRTETSRIIYRTFFGGKI